MYGDRHFICAPIGLNKTDMGRDLDTMLGVRSYDDRFGSAFATTTLNAAQIAELKALGYHVRLNIAPYTNL
jgi:hypothetical protein